MNTDFLRLARKEIRNRLKCSSNSSYFLALAPDLGLDPYKTKKSIK